MQYSVVLLSDLDQVVYRLDAEYYHPNHLAAVDKLQRLNCITIRDASGEFDCSAFYPSIVPYYNFNNQGIPFLRVNEIQNGLLSISSDTAFLPERILAENSTTIARCFPDDLIIAKGGNSLGKVALLTDSYPMYSICRDVIVLRTGNLKQVNRYYLWMFLHSEIGQSLILRTASQTGQPHLTIEALYNLNIPLFSGPFQACFESLYIDSQEAGEKSLKFYAKAEDLLLSELGLLDWQPRHQLAFVKKYSDTVESERFDAEYFQPKYEEIIKAIQAYPGGWEPLGDLVRMKTKNFTPKEKQEYDYIELANIAGNGEITGCTTDQGANLPSRARRQVKTDDLIVSSVEGSLTRIALVPGQFNNALCSTGFHVVESSTINPETLLVLLKSVAAQTQLKKGCRGTILTAINTDDFKKIALPRIRDEVQREIQTMVQESVDLRKRSKHLLECAKRAVEIAIEQDEDTAQAWLSEQTG